MNNIIIIVPSRLLRLTFFTVYLFIYFLQFAMDSSHQSNYKLSKTEKKFLRKQIKARHTLLRHEGIETVSYATQVT